MKNYQLIIIFAILYYHLSHKMGECNEISHWSTYLPYQIHHLSHDMKNAWVFPQLSFLRMWRLEREFLKSKVLSLRAFEDDHTSAYTVLNASEIVACKSP